jgi:hypothetical protein
MGVLVLVVGGGGGAGFEKEGWTLSKYELGACRIISLQ